MNLKKLTSGALLLAFLFNLGGYYLVFWGLRYQADKQTWSRLNAEQYSSEETVFLKIPMTLPYPVNEGVYEEIKLEFEHNDIFYKGIKQKLEQDTLYILCFKDQHEKRLANTLADYEKVSNDLSSKSKQSQDLLIKILKEYEGFCQIEVVEQHGWSMILPYPESSLNLIAFERSVQVPPPKTLS